ncbi:MAG: hypothetical protein IKF72_00015 [Kiritimatiellae bacterium]|nr:hypothetical protein [Kiritimatiellia bacterium]
MKKTLGLDLGTNSLGWAVLDDTTGDILEKGVVVFPEGIDAASDTLETPAAIRRAARMARRMKFRRKLRKWKLLEILGKNEMSPISEKELETWKKSGIYPIDNKAFINWLKSTDTSNPYADRAAATSGKVSPLVLGRALYHIAQRRGFKSSRKDALADGTESKDLGAVKGDIAALTKEIADAGCRTLGQYFAKRIESERNSLCKTRVRKRYTGRVEHYMTEFAVIMETQGIAHSNPLYKSLYDAIFRQRPLRSQKHLVGPCPLEHRNPRSQIGHPAFEEFRMRTFVNNLSFRSTTTDERIPLTAEDRELACSAFMKESSTIKFSSISKLFKKKFKNESLKFHHYESDDTVTACSTRCKIKNGFGDIPYAEQKVFDALTFFDDEEKLKGWFRHHYPALSEENVVRLAKIHPKEGNAQYSLKAINKILPFLRKGHDLFTARLLAKMPDVIPQFAEHEDEIVLHIREMEAKCRAAREAMRIETFRREGNPPRLMDLLREYLLTEWNVDDKAWNKLYLHGDSPYEVDPKQPDRIPAVALGMIRNPLVQRSMTTLRRLVNYLRDHGKIDGDTTIRIELARSVNDYATRHAVQLWQKDRAALRDKARQELGASASEDLVDRYILWEEQGRMCLYTGKTISLGELVSGNSFDIEHTIPRSMSGDDSLANKTLCDAKYNREVKKGMVPTDCPNYESEIFTRLAPWRERVEGLRKTWQSRRNAAKAASDPQQRANARIKAIRTKLELDYWRDKLRRFEITSDKLIDPANGLSGFKRRQLVDTGIMSSHAVELLRSVYPNVYSVNGAATAFARKAWGIQGNEAKDRAEHTHHAKDAMVIAALTPSRFNAICTALKDDGGVTNVRPCDLCKPPYEGFAEKVRKATGEILVKHVLRQTTLRQSSKRNALAKAHPQKADPTKTIKFVNSKGDTVRGALHKDTFYGCIARPDNGKKAFVVRKPLTGPIAAIETLVDKIVDVGIRDIVSSALVELKKSGIKTLEPGMIKMPSGVPVNKVRTFAQTTNPMRLKDHAIASQFDYKMPYYVRTSEGSNFRLGVFKANKKLSIKPDNALVWAQSHKKPDYAPLHKQEGFIGYIVPGSMAIAAEHANINNTKELKPAELSKRLYKVVKFESTGRITFRRHLEARASVVLEKDLKAIGKHKTGESSVNFENPHELLYLSPGVYFSNMLFEGIHFKMMLDGTIIFL